jgi:hypothetical protein
VKRCGKSAPRAWQHERHGKPHREQNRIGATRGFSAEEFLDPSPDRCPGWLLEAAGNGRPRGMAIARATKTRAIQNPAYRPAGAALRTPEEFETKKVGVFSAKADIAAAFAQVELVLDSYLTNRTFSNALDFALRRYRSNE